MYATNGRADTAAKKEQFWRVDIEELRMLYQKKWITATAYVYGIVKIFRQDGWWLRFNTKAFAKEYGIPQPSLYRAITALAADPDIDFEWSAKELRVRFAKAEPPILMDENTLETPESIDLPLGHSQQGELISSVRKNSHERENFLIREKEFSSVRKSQPETLTQQSAQPSYRYLTDTKHTHTDNAQPDGSPLPHPEEVCVNLELSESQPKEEFQVRATNDQKQIEKSRPVKKSLGLDQDAAPRENDSRKLTKEEILTAAGIAPEDFDPYLKHVASTLKQKTVGAALTAIANNPARARLGYEEWKKQTSADIPTLANREMGDMPHSFHATMRQYFNNPKLSRERFLSIDYAAEWLEWAQTNHPEWLQSVA
jgi:hypothetical protein